MRVYLRGLLGSDRVKLTGAVLLVCMVVYHQFIFGNYFFIWSDLGSDTLNSYWPAYTYFSNSLRQGFESFSLEIGTGINIFSGSLLFFDPFAWLYVFFNYWGIARLFVFVFILKNLIGSLFFHRFIGFFVHSRSIAFLIALLYAFNSFAVVWGQHSILGTIVMVFPMILLGIERAIREDRPLLLILSTALGMVSTYYFMYMAAFFLAVYLPTRLVCFSNRDFRGIVWQAAKIGSAFVLGTGLSAAVLLPTIAATLTTNRLQGQLVGIPIFTIADVKTLLTIIGSLFSNSLLGTTDSFVGIGNYYDSPHLYSGLLSLMVIPQILIAPRKTDKIFALILSVFSVVCLIFPFMAAMFNGFSILAYRWSYFIIVFTLISAAIAMQAITDRQRASGTLLKLTLHGLIFSALLASLGFFIIHYMRDRGGFQGTIPLVVDTLLRVLPVIGLLCAYFLLLMKFQWKYRSVLLISLVVMEIIWNTGATIWGRNPVSTDYSADKISYFDHSLDAAKNIGDMDNGLYRVDKSFYSQFLNDGLMQGYRNIHGYWSIIPGTTLNFFDAVGGATELNMQLGLIESDVIRSLLGVKYYLVRSLDDVPEDYELVGQWGDVFALRNNHWVPMGSVYYSFISKSNIQNFSIEDRDIVIAKACVIPDELVEEVRAMGLQEVFSYADFTDGWSDSAAYDDLVALSSNRMQIQVSQDDYIEGNLTSPAAGIVFFPINADKGWDVFVDNDEKTIIDTNWGMIGVFVEPGTQKIILRYTPPMFREGVVVSVISIFAVLSLFVFSRGFLGKRLPEKFRI